MNSNNSNTLKDLEIGNQKNNLFLPDSQSTRFYKKTEPDHVNTKKINNNIVKIFGLGGVFRMAIGSFDTYVFNNFQNQSVVFEERVRNKFTLSEAHSMSMGVMKRTEVKWNNYFKEEAKKYYISEDF